MNDRTYSEPKELTEPFSTLKWWSDNEPSLVAQHPNSKYFLIQRKRVVSAGATREEVFANAGDYKINEGYVLMTRRENIPSRR